jgi:hypothetical protein
VTCADANRALDLRDVAWEDDGAGDGAEVREAITLVGLDLSTIDDEIRVAHSGAELRNDLRREHSLMVSRSWWTPLRVRL